MAWIESHTTMRNHKKLIALCNELKISRAEAIGHIHMLWWWAIDNRENGDLSGLFDRDVALACDWDKEPKTLIKALEKTGWVKDGKIVDWLDYAGRLLNDRLRLRKWRKNSHETFQETIPIQLTEPNITIKRVGANNSDFLETLKANKAYSHINLSLELAKMDAWLAAHPGRKKTHRFIVNWLNKIEAPLPEEKKPGVYDGLRKLVM